MKIKILGSKINKKLSAAREILNSQVDSNNLGSHILIEANEDSFIFYSSDREINKIANENISTSEGEEVISPGKISVPFKSLQEISAIYSKEIFEITHRDDDKAIISLSSKDSNSKTLKIQCTDGAAYPLFRMEAPEYIIKISSQVLHRLIRTSSFAVSKTSAINALKHFFITINNKEIMTVGADNPRIAISTYTLPTDYSIYIKKPQDVEITEESPLNILLPTKCYKILEHLTKNTNDDDFVELSLYKKETGELNRISAKINNIEIISTLSNAQYPNCAEIFPKTHVYKIDVNLEELRTAIKVANTIDPNEVKFSLENNSIIIDVKDKQENSFKEVISGPSEGESGGQIVVLNKYVTDVLRNIPENNGAESLINIKVCCINDTTSLVFNEVNPSITSSKYVVMPMYSSKQ